MEYSEIKVFIKMNEDIKSDEMYSVLSKYINKSLLNDSKMKRVHETNCFKFYTFGLPYPIEKEKIYKKDKLYAFNVRSISREVIMRVGRVLERNCNEFTLEGKDFKSYVFDKIEKIISLTPVVVTRKDQKYWTKECGTDELCKQLSSNAEKKLKAYYGKIKIEEGTNFIEEIKQKNNRLILVPYKGGYVAGNKFEIKVKSDETSQLLAGVVAAMGLGEKCSAIGMGYCKVL